MVKVGSYEHEHVDSIGLCYPCQECCNAVAVNILYDVLSSSFTIDRLRYPSRYRYEPIILTNFKAGCEQDSSRCLLFRCKTCLRFSQCNKPEWVLTQYLVGVKPVNTTQLRWLIGIMGHGGGPNGRRDVPKCREQERCQDWQQFLLSCNPYRSR